MSLKRPDKDNMNKYNNAFNEDTILQNTFAKLVETYKPELILETGTHRGETTEFLCDFGIPVISTEINQGFYDGTKARIGRLHNLVMLLGDSAVALEQNFSLIQDKKILMFLDSHCLNDRVLERELVLFKRLKYKPVMVIHDFFVPNKDFGYDSWDGYRYDFEAFKSYFEDLYGKDKYQYQYNSEAVGKRRGVIITFPTENT